MAEEKTYTQLVDEAHYNAHLGNLKPMSKPRKYKKERKNEEEREEVGVGTRFILRHSEGRSVVGYALATVIDIEDDEEFWGMRTHFIVEINEVSNPEMDNMVNRLRHISGYKWWGDKFEIVEIGKANWEDYKL